MKITNKAGLPDAIVQAVRNDPYPTTGTGDISATRLIGPPQQRILTRQHWDEIEEDAIDRVWALMGQVAHGILERAETLAFTEDRLFASIEGWNVSGQFDRMLYLWDQSAYLMQDYKLTSVWAVLGGAKPEWIAQLNILRYLAIRNGYPVDRLQIVAILRDWSRGKARQGGNYPRQQVQVIDVPTWSVEDTEGYIRERVQLHQLADKLSTQGRALPQCTEADRWAKPDVYAVRKPGRKTAVKLFTNQESAARHITEKAIPSGYIEIRRGESIRCADYCAAAPFCSQWAQIRQVQEETQEAA